MNTFGINVIHANSPEAKGRIERAFDTLQDRLVAEMELAKVGTIEEANIFLNNYFLPEIFNKNFTVEPEIKESAFTSLITTDLNDHFYTKAERVVKNDHTISYGGRLWDLVPIESSLVNETVEIRFYPNGETKLFWKDREIFLKGISLLAA